MLKMHHLHFHHHIEPDQEVLERLDAIFTKLGRMETKIMATLDQVLADVKAENTQLDSLGAFIAGLKQQITDALAGATLPAEIQAKVDAVFALTEANTAKIATAMNTTSTVPPPVTPAPTAPLPVNTDPIPPTPTPVVPAPVTPDPTSPAATTPKPFTSST